MQKHRMIPVTTILFGALLLTSCANNTDSSTENRTGDAESSNSETTNNGDVSQDSAESDGATTEEVTAHITFNGDDLALSDLHCGPVAAEDNEMRFLASFDGGEIQIDGSGGPDGSAVIHVRIDGESDYTNSAGPHVDFPESGVQADVELSNADEEKAPVVVNISC